MSRVVANRSMSLDGFVADRLGGVEHLFGWYDGGPATVRTADPRWTFHTDEASAADLRELFAGDVALVCGRRLFDLTDGWGGRHPTGAPIFVVTHTLPDGWPREDAPVTFINGGVEGAGEGRQRQRRPAVPRRRAAGRDLRRPGACPVERRHPLLRQPRQRSGGAGRRAGDRRVRRDPPGLPRDTSPRMSRA